MPNETLHAILADGLGPRWFGIVRGVCRLWRAVVDASATVALRRLPDDHECLCGAAPERVELLLRSLLSVRQASPGGR
jgi:hypothetical protein